MKRAPLLIALAAFLATLHAAAQHRAGSTISASQYDRKKQETIYTVFPYGDLSLPGKWKKSSYNEISRQQRFRSGDTVSALLAIVPATSYPFFKAGMDANEISREMYEWDSKYLAEQIRGERTVLRQDTAAHFILWRLTGSQGAGVNQLFLFGAANGIVFNVSLDAPSWPEAQQSAFLEETFRKKTACRRCD